MSTARLALLAAAVCLALVTLDPSLDPVIRAAVRGVARGGVILGASVAALKLIGDLIDWASEKIDREGR